MSDTLHCTHCGAAHSDRGWPKRCPSCTRMTWRNPTPVAVALVPVEGQGLLTIRRDIEPAKGELALPGGYIDFGETWQQAMAREVKEETEVVIDPAGVRLFDVLSPPDGKVVLIFGVTPPLAPDVLPEFSGSSETSERAVIAGPQEMAFPLHTQVVQDYFAKA